MRVEYRFKTKPFDHQRREFEAHATTPARARFWEQGTGKSKAAIDEAAVLFQLGEIDALLVLAPNGVHHNWATDELPAHCTVPYSAFAWSSRSARAKWHQLATESLLRHPHLAVLLMSYDAFMTKAGRKYAVKFAEKRRAMCVLDESQRIKSPRAKRTRSVVAFGSRFKYKRILSGTPVTNSPFDVYSQLKFLDADFWKPHGFACYEPFKTYFGFWEQRINGSTGQRFKQCVYFMNLDKLAAIVDTVATRVTKEQALDLPPKTYTKRYFELGSKQRALYDAVRDEFEAELESGATLTAPLVIVRLLRLQQIACGYAPTDNGELVELGENPRLTLLLDTLADLDGQKAIVFARFRKDVDQICAELGPNCVRYDGAVDEKARVVARTRFQDPQGPRVFVGNPAACGLGLTLHAASTVVYYSNSFNLEHRLQSEDRAHRIGQTRSVGYVDLIAKNTVDARLVGALRGKRNLAATITRDEIKEWL